MTKEKKMYQVFVESFGSQRLLGETWATSEGKAISQVYFRTFGRTAKSPQDTYFAKEA